MVQIVFQNAVEKNVIGVTGIYLYNKNISDKIKIGIFQRKSEIKTKPVCLYNLNKNG